MVPKIADRCVVVNGVAKTYAMTGWRVGWLIGPTDVVKAVTNLQSHATSNVANVVPARPRWPPSRATCPRSPRCATAFDRRRRIDPRDARRGDGVECVEPEGAFYAFPSVKGLLGRGLAGRRPTSSAELAEICIDEAKVALVPGEAFGAPGYLRLSYALGDDDLREGCGGCRPSSRKPPRPHIGGIELEARGPA